MATIETTTTIGGSVAYVTTDPDGRTWSAIHIGDRLHLTCTPTTAEQLLPFTDHRPALPYEGEGLWNPHGLRGCTDETAEAVATEMLTTAVAWTQREAVA